MQGLGSTEGHGLVGDVDVFKTGANPGNASQHSFTRHGMEFESLEVTTRVLSFMF